MSTTSTLAFPFTSLAQPLSFTLGIVAVLCGLHFLSTYGSRPKDLPPGPATLPILGNLTIFPRANLHIKFTEWKKVYGDVFSLQVMNKTVIVLNSPTAIREIIDKRGVSSSSRPKSIISDMLTPRGLNFGTCNNADEQWNVLRKSAMQLLNNQNMRRQRDLHRAEGTQLLYDLVQDPENWYLHVQRNVVSFILAIVYGRRAPLITSKQFTDAINFHPRFIDALEIGRLPPVDLFPILLLVPERFAEWKKTVRDIRKLNQDMFDDLLTTVEKRIARGESTPGFMEEAIKHAKEFELLDHETLMNLGGTFLAGYETSAAALQVFVMTLVNFPAAAQKARDEIDRVVGIDRAPTWADIPNLPYTMAFIEETIRFRPVGPLGLPHEMSSTEVVDGMRYPKGATLFINTWAMFHDERYFENPEEFMPERFLNNPYGTKGTVQDDVARRPNLLFGGGRRVCPGMALAKDNMELNVCNLIWAFDFLPMLDSSGNELPPDLNNFSTGLTGYPLPFKCRIVPRSSQHVEIIKQEFAKAADVLRPYELPCEMTDEEKKYNAHHRDLSWEGM